MSVINTHINHAPHVSVISSGGDIAVEDMKSYLRKVPEIDFNTSPISNDMERTLSVDVNDLAIPVEPINIGELISALKYRSAEKYPEWWAGLACIKGAGLPEEEAKKIARDYSKTSAKHNDTDFDYVWEGIQSDGGYTHLTIYKDAREAGWDGSISLGALAAIAHIDPTLFETAQDGENKLKGGGVEDLIKKFTMSDTAISQLADPSWLIPNLVIKGHMSVFPAAPNAGKTTIFMHLAGEMTKLGGTVLYVNADISASDAKRDLAIANQQGFNLLLPDLVGGGLSMENVVNQLRNMIISGQYMDNTVFIFDTLKKMTDVINKSQAKELFKLFRAMTAKGATIICLAHTNKYNGLDGKPIFEGTGDLRADFDELIYLIPVKNPDGTMTVSTAPDKVRGDFSPTTYTIDKDRTVKLELGFVDTVKQAQLNRQRDDDQEAIDAITDVIKSGVTSTEEIIKTCTSVHDISCRGARIVLKRYKLVGASQLWASVHSKTANKVIFKLLGE